MSLSVNGIEIGEDRIREEMQYHPAPSPDEARKAAETALIVRTLLLSEAHRAGFDAVVVPLRDDASNLVEAPDEAAIRTLIERRIAAPEPSDAECRAYYEATPQSFRSPDLLQAAHILVGARSDDKAGLATAKQKAEAALARLNEKPELFGDLARELSDCTSRAHGGDLGQVTRGSTVPEFETFLFALEPGQICPLPVRTRYGYHIIRLDQRLDGRALPYEAVRNRISTYLRERQWQEAVRAYISDLMVEADVKRGEAVEPSSGSCGSGCGCAKTVEVPS